VREHRDYSKNDDAPLTDGDTGFVGVDMRTAPHLLPAGFVADARNARFRFGVAEPRMGVMPIAYGETYFEFPIEWNNGDIDWSRQFRADFGDVFGVGVWNDPNGLDWILIAASTNGTTIDIWRLRQGNAATRVPVAVTLSVPTSSFQDVNSEDLFWFTQAFDKCILSRGYDNTHLVMSDLLTGFVEAPAASGAGGTENIPNAKTALFLQNRLLVPHRPTGAYKADHVAVSDILDYTSYDPVYSSFKINQGDADNIERLYAFNDQTVVVFKTTSIYAVTGLYGEWQNNAVLDQVTSEYGLVGPRSVANTGSDLWFLSQRGVVSLRQTEQNKLQGVSLPASSPIQPLIDRIDMNTARVSASAAYWRNRYYLSVPLDGSQQNNAVLVYDFLNQAWSGYDEGDAIRIKYLFVADFNGTEQLHYVDYDGVVGLYEYGELEGRPITQTTYTCDLLLTGQPAIGNTVSVNDGTRVVGTRLSTLVESDTDIITDGTDDIIVDPRTDALPGDGVWDMGDESADPCETAADNLHEGFDTGGWTHNADTVTQLDCGVRFTSDSPITITADDPYLSVFCSSEIQVEDRPIQFMVTTRGYGYAAGNRRRNQQAQLFISTWDPEYRVTGIVDGVKEETVLLDDTSYTFPSRTRYMTFGIDDWDLGNPDDDHERAGREDYSLVLKPSVGTILGDQGMQLDLYQYYTHKLRVDRRGAYFQIKVEGLDGRVRLHSVTSGSTPGQRREGVHGGIN